jgi:hypothetical protein
MEPRRGRRIIGAWRRSIASSHHHRTAARAGSIRRGVICGKHLELLSEKHVSIS